jgi:hypothetical protein
MRRMYSENQIKAIASGGKLYLHKLVNDDFLGLWLLSTDNEKITVDNKIEKYKKVIMLYGTSGDGITWKRIAPQELLKFGFNADGDIITDGFNNFPIVSDEVEEL